MLGSGMGEVGFGLKSKTVFLSCLNESSVEESVFLHVCDLCLWFVCSLL